MQKIVIDSLMKYEKTKIFHHVRINTEKEIETEFVQTLSKLVIKISKVSSQTQPCTAVLQLYTYSMIYTTRNFKMTLKWFINSLPDLFDLHYVPTKLNKFSTTLANFGIFQ